MKKYIDAGKVDTRSGFGEGLVLAGRENENVLALTADLKGSLKMDAFAAEFPERFIQCGERKIGADAVCNQHKTAAAPPLRGEKRRKFLSRFPRRL